VLLTYTFTGNVADPLFPHKQCCNPESNNGSGWGIFNAILGWTNSATYGSVISYNLYWIAVMTAFVVLRYGEVHGHWPLMKAKETTHTQVEYTPPNGNSGSDTGEPAVVQEK
jgi:high-affinity iron transporter